MTALVATDLDRTMIYSRRALGELGGTDEPVCVEIHEGVPTSYMTASAAAAFGSLAAQTLVVPVTTRIPEQYARVNLPGPVPRYAVASNGGVIFVDGRADRDWERQVAAAVAGVTPQREIWATIGALCDPWFTDKLRSADGLFCYAVIRPERLPEGFEEDMRGWAAERGWCTSLQGRKLYWVPEPLTKSAAMAEVARRAGATLTLAAGDSLLDVDLLLWADRGIHPRHGELFEQGWAARRVERTAVSGAAAGEEILAWFATQLGLPVAGESAA
jgi:hypothetical protein